MTGGSGRQIYHWYMNGECKTKVPVTPNTVYNISINDQSKDKKVSHCYSLISVMFVVLVLFCDDKFYG